MLTGVTSITSLAGCMRSRIRLDKATSEHFQVPCLTLLLILQRQNSSSSSKSAHSTYSMHKGAGPVQRKRKPHNHSPSEPAKKRRIARTPSEVLSGQGLRDGMVPSKNTRP